jgi:hypothetical protein
MTRSHPAHRRPYAQTCNARSDRGAIRTIGVSGA